ncbi:MAG TPA: tetratricopeptide repeat protein, partial [Turneriella sp.]|nr:tetratricopeptide repeat protein [Turneriella sp.]
TVKEFSFKVGDILFLASDGRDDIVIKEGDSNTTRVINEDEKAFLNVILRGEGDLQKTVNNLRQTGGLSDDLSIIRIEILGFNSEAIRKEKKSIKETVRERLVEIKDLIRKKNYAGAAHALQHVSTELSIENVPEYYILLSRIQLNDGQLQMARQSLEKALQLGHEVAPAYKSLGNIFYKLKMLPEAIDAWEHALKLNPDDKALSHLLRDIEAQKTTT